MCLLLKSLFNVVVVLPCNFAGISKPLEIAVNRHDSRARARGRASSSSGEGIGFLWLMAHCSYCCRPAFAHRGAFHNEFISRAGQRRVHTRQIIQLRRLVAPALCCSPCSVCSFRMVVDRLRGNDVAKSDEKKQNDTFVYRRKEQQVFRQLSVLFRYRSSTDGPESNSSAVICNWTRDESAI